VPVAAATRCSLFSIHNSLLVQSDSPACGNGSCGTGDVFSGFGFWNEFTAWLPELKTKAYAKRRFGVAWKRGR
jgi:hypothetical protein